ncbi:DEAD/DEAH box helicase [Gordonia metallireducens]|uniref:DEAD/DEAH box helicase n=1 Tax=Gordonia metallireducens TaxID=2897779 RepID=UPI001E3FD386|nr:DEAD/DEAH box helicase [Gordonia metallireducens]
MQTLCDSIRGEIVRVGPLTSVELADRLSATVTEIQQALLDHDAVFAPPPRGAEAWDLVSADELSERLGMSRPLRPWQTEALQKWMSSGRVGVVEAVTGAGKTDVGIAAIADARRRGVPTLILVPDRELVDHWRRILETSLPGVKVGTPDDSKALAVPEQLIVCTPAGLGKRRLTAFRGAGLLIVDELQRIPVADYTDVVFPRAEITERLGLTAAYEWSSSQTERIVRPYLGDLIEGCDYQRAVAEGILGRPLVLTVGVSFSRDERDDYDACSQRLSDAERKLRDTGVDLSAGLYETARQIDSGALVGEISFLAKEYLDALAARRRVLDECAAKVSAVGSMARGLGDARRTIVFTPADHVSAGVVDAVLPAAVTASPIVSNQDPSWVLGRFTTGTISLLATSRLMDDGIAVPTSQVGIVLATARTRAQMLQRMGRVVHPTDWVGRTAFVLVYVNATVEDPDVGGSEGHAEDLMAIAAEHFDVTAEDAVRHLASWLGGDSREPHDASDTVDAEVVVSDEWDPEDAILDIFEEYDGLLTWTELKEVLPDLEVEQAIMRGIDGITWMKIGDNVVGLGGRQSTQTESRISALDIVATLKSSSGGQPVDVREIADRMRSVGTEFQSVSIERLEQIWTALGGFVAESVTAADQYSASLDAAHGSADESAAVTADLASAEVTQEPSRRPVSPAVQTVIDELEAQGASVDIPSAHPTGVLNVLSPSGIRRTVRVHSGIGGSWRVSQTDAELTAGDDLDAVVFTDRGSTPPAFYVAPVTPYVKRVRAVIDAWVKSHPRDSRSGHVNIEKWVVQDGLNRWDLLWPKEKPALETVSEPLIEERPDIEFRHAEPEPVSQSSEIQYSPEGDVRVVLVHEDAKVVGFFDPRTSRLRIASAPGAAKLAGRDFRNPAIAAGTVMSVLSGRTTFGVGFDNWIVDENTRETLAGYLDDDRSSVSAGA